ncbi:RNA-directed DNA polymerase [Candidatus Saccharibacteria bacterium]|nr:RNA-directed DNA polymerase [Candidatus Saccharibacteria bacterium]
MPRIEEDELVQYNKRLRVLTNLVEATRIPKKSKSNAPKRDRNLLSRLPQNDADLEDALYECLIMARRGKMRTVDEWNFEVHWEENLKNLAEDIRKRRWKPSPSKAFIVHEPVDREIFAAPFRDRLVHHLLYAVVAPWWDKQFVYDSYSCRRGKGTDFGVERMQKFMRAASVNGTKKAYVLKGDLSGYFMSLPRKALYRKVMWGLRRQFPKRGWLYELCAYLWKEVIFDDPCLKARIVGSPKDWECLPASKSLFCQDDGYGIVIGNLTSQLLSNIMLNEFDWYVKKVLKFERYGRYVDDFFMVVEESEYEWAKRAMRNEIPQYLKKMGLKMHPKKIYMQEVSKGCPFLGKMVRPNVVTPGKRYLKNMRRAFREYVAGRGSYDTMQSYVGMGTHMAAYTAMKKVIETL